MQEITLFCPVVNIANNHKIHPKYLSSCEYRKQSQNTSKVFETYFKQINSTNMKSNIIIHHKNISKHKKCQKIIIKHFTNPNLTYLL